MAKISVALMPHHDPAQRGKTKLRKPGTPPLVVQYWTEEPSEADDGDPMVRRLLSKRILRVVEPAKNGKKDKEQ